MIDDGEEQMARRFACLAAFIALLILTACSPAKRQFVDSAGNPLPRTEDGKLLTESTRYWLKRVEEFRAANPAHKPSGIVLLGDSLTERSPFALMSPELPLINRGIGGDKIGGWEYYGVLDRLDVSVAQLQPRKVFLMIGINDIVYANTPPKSMRINYTRLVKEIRENAPEAEIYLYSILPARNGFAQFNEKIRDFNEFIASVAGRQDCYYVDLHSFFTDADGILDEQWASDAVHLNEKGYKRWREIVLPYLYK